MAAPTVSSEPSPPKLTDDSGWPHVAAPKCIEHKTSSSAAMCQQHNAAAACKDFFSKETSDEEDSDDEEKEGEREAEAFKFFVGLFDRYIQLKDFYEKNWECGDFCCLVCGSIGVKAWKRFNGCIALVQHASSIAKTKKKVAHRAFSRAVCRVLGWDINRLPSIVIDRGDTLGATMAKTSIADNAEEHDQQGSFADELL